MRIVKQQNVGNINKYKGIPILANFMVHERIFELVEQYLKNKLEAKILVLGSGKGAFERRLLDHGFSNIVSVDIVDNLHESVREKVRFMQVDLNTNFSEKIREKFDIIIAIEVIEHLYCPYCFLKEVRKLIKDDGVVIITSPNPVEIYRTLMYTILGGELPWFDEPAVQEKYGHISVITVAIMKRLAELTGFRLEKVTYNRTFPEIIVKPNNAGVIWYFKLVIGLFAYYIIKALTKNKKYKEGVINIYVLRPKV